MPHHTEIYPMPMFPTLSVKDIRESETWYSVKLGFSVIFTIPGADGAAILVHLRWRKYADVLLVPNSSEAHPRGIGVALSFLMESETVDDMAARLEANGVEIEEGPIDRPWNTRDIIVLDPDGYRLVFFEPIDISKSFDEVIEQTIRTEVE